MTSKFYNVTPVPKPRMTQRDRWAKRPAVMRYWAFCDEIRDAGCTLPEFGAHVTFHMPMPKSWSKKKKREMLGQPHKQRPDWDNLAKALQDAVMPEDSVVWNMQVTKVWAEKGGIEICRKKLFTLIGCNHELD